jgi:FkbM family methyltransferase
MKTKLSIAIICLKFITVFAIYANPTRQIFYSQYQQDQYLYENFFKNKKEGVFVDIGAHDGITINNTYFFEKNMEWTGLCIEPLPDVYNRLKINRNCACVQACIFDNRDSISFLQISGYAEMLSGIIENYNPEHIKRIRKEIDLKGGKSELIQVKCYNFNDLLKNHNILKIDLLSVDTEGGELEIIKSIDFSFFDIDGLC